MEIQDLVTGIGLDNRRGNHTFGALPSYYSRAKTTSRDREIMRELFTESGATRYELALAFGISTRTVYNYTR